MSFEEYLLLKEEKFLHITVLLNLGDSHTDRERHTDKVRDRQTVRETVIQIGRDRQKYRETYR